MKSEEENFESIVGGKHQKINSTFHSHRKSRFKNPKISRSQRFEVWILNPSLQLELSLGGY
jgi:hypothetical protein